MIRIAAFLFFLPFVLYGVQIDESLIDTNGTKLYETYLSQLEKEANQSDVTLQLQRSLLDQLIEFEESKDKKPFAPLMASDIKNKQDYLKAFLRYVENFTETKRIKKELKGKEEKIDYLKKQIITGEENQSIQAHISVPSIAQLQYAFYVKSQEKLQSTLEQIRELKDQNRNILLKRLESIDFLQDKQTQDTTAQEMKLKQLQLEREGLEIEKERLLLLQNQIQSNQIDEKRKLLSQKIDDIVQDFVNKNLYLYFAALKVNDQKVFDIRKAIEDDIALMSPQKQRAASNMLDALGKLASERIGTTKVLASQTKEGVVTLGKDIWEMLHYPLFSINKKQISSWDLILALSIFAFGLFLASLYRRYIRKISLRLRNLSLSSQVILSNVGSYFIIGISFFVMLKTIGLDLSSFTVIAGALSVGIGFGLQNIIANFISGIILFFEKSIKIGDFLQISDTLRGRVADIRMRSVTIRTNDNIDVIVPNQTFIQQQVINWTLSDDIRRMHIPFGVAYGSDIDGVKRVVLEALEKSDIEYIRNDKDREPQVIMKAMNASSVDFELWVWMHGDSTLKPSGTQDKFLVLLYKTLYENNIQIPFPQLDLHIQGIKEILEGLKKEA
ncbi:MAG: mechanosensitive ion channel [Campylobacterales bacterium]|nr:mechanosensitive ion channel [Campylobacterales bacterium]